MKGGVVSAYVALLFKRFAKQVFVELKSSSPLEIPTKGMRHFKGETVI